MKARLSKSSPLEGNDNSPEFRDCWELTQKRGIVLYVAETGLLVWGMPLFLIASIAFGLPVDPFTSAIAFVFSLLTCLALGCGLAFIVWILSQKRYEKSAENR